jgi:hypothetical protein
MDRCNWDYITGTKRPSTTARMVDLDVPATGAPVHTQLTPRYGNVGFDAWPTGTLARRHAFFEGDTAALAQRFRPSGTRNDQFSVDGALIRVRFSVRF